MNEAEQNTKDSARNLKTTIVWFAVATFFVYYLSNPKPQFYYNYTFRVAENILRGSIGFTEKPPPWLNEFVPFDGNWYSVFPLGSVLSMIPFALLKVAGFVREMPGAFISAFSASVISIFLFAIAARYEIERNKRILLISSVLFGTWMWTNLTFAGAWQLTLGLAMIGELGAIYYTIYNPKPWLAGAFFALAFGNRTENLLTAPIFIFLLLRNKRPDVSTFESSNREKSLEQNDQKSDSKSKTIAGYRNLIRELAAFCVIPFFLGAETLIYNYVRFGSYTDFGYARIPGVLDEPWYNHGIFSVYYIPGQAWEMLVRLWEVKTTFPYYVPNGFSSSILLTSPFLFLMLRRGATDVILKYVAWTAIFILTFLLWIHGNSGGWQFGYRYAMILLPWVFVILLENSPRKITSLEWFLYIFSILANIYATYLFHWTDYVKP